MNGTGSDHDQKAIIPASEDCFRLCAGIVNEIGGLAGDGEVVREDRRGDQRVNSPNAEVICFVGRHGGKRWWYRCWDARAFTSRIN